MKGVLCYPTEFCKRVVCRSRGSMNNIRRLVHGATRRARECPDGLNSALNATPPQNTLSVSVPDRILSHLPCESQYHSVCRVCSCGCAFGIPCPRLAPEVSTAARLSVLPSSSPHSQSTRWRLCDARPFCRVLQRPGSPPPFHILRPLADVCALSNIPAGPLEDQLPVHCLTFLLGPCETAFRAS